MSDSKQSIDISPTEPTHAETVLPVGLGTMGSELGASAGAVAGPVGMVAGAVVGGVAGMVVGMAANEGMGVREHSLRGSEE